MFAFVFAWRMTSTVAEIPHGADVIAVSVRIDDRRYRLVGQFLDLVQNR